MSPKLPPRSLRGHAWFPTVVNYEFHVINVVSLSQGSSVSILKSLTCLEGFRLQGVSRVSFKESKMVSLIPDWSHFFIDMHRGIIVQIFKSLASLEVSYLLVVSMTSSKESKRTLAEVKSLG